MTTTRRTLSSLAVLALAAGLMTGCGDKDDPSPSAGSEATASAPVEQSDGGGESAKSDVPKPDPKDYAGMDEHTDEGAEQAFRYYYDLATWGYQTGEVAELKTLQDPDCELCTSLVQDIERVKRKSTQWSPIEVTVVDLYHQDVDGYEIGVAYSFKMSEHEEPVSGNDKEVSVPETTYVAAGGLEWYDGWKVGNVSSETFEN